MKPNSDLPNPHSPELLSPTGLGGRWGCGSDTAQKRAKQLGIPVIRFNRRVIRYKLADVEAAEAAAMSRPPTASS